MADGKTRRILVVDDNHALVRIMEAVLQKHGYQVLTAFDGFSAIELALNQKPDLIILDIEMPGIDGYRVCHRLQRSEITAKIPVLMLTVKGQVDEPGIPSERTLAMRVAERNRGYEVGATDFISKPIRAQDLVERVKMLLWVDTASPGENNR
jgi:DNA-binding response OmpR family regulator